MSGFMIILFLLILLPVFISTMFIPYWTRKTESFGVSIPEKIYYSAELKEMRQQYTRITGILGILTTTIFLLLGRLIVNDETTLSIIFSIVILLYLLLTFIVYYQFHRKMKELKKRKKWSEEKSQVLFVNMKFRDHKLTYSNFWFLIPFAITMFVIVITLQNYHLIPDNIPMQYDFEGNITNWTEKSYKSVLMMPIMSVYLTLLFLFINSMIGKAKQQIDADRPNESMRQNVIFRRRWSAYIILTGALLSLLFSFIQLSFIYPIDQELLTYVPLIFAAIVTIGAIVLSITTGQGGSRVKSQSNTTIDGTIINRDDDRHWKLGVLYFNKKDPALFLEKRFGVGWTINYARPLAWMIFLLIIGLAIGIPYLLN
jgi:uncharacterized membrane protein